MPQSNLNRQPTESPDLVQPDFDDMSIAEPADSGIKGGLVSKDALDPSDTPMSLVDFLWKHHND